MLVVLDFFINRIPSSQLRARLQGGGEPQVGEVTCLGGVTCLSI